MHNVKELLYNFTLFMILDAYSLLFMSDALSVYYLSIVHSELQFYTFVITDLATPAGP